MLVSLQSAQGARFAARKPARPNPQAAAAPSPDKPVKPPAEAPAAQAASAPPPAAEAPAAPPKEKKTFGQVLLDIVMWPFRQLYKLFEKLMGWDVKPVSFYQNRLAALEDKVPPFKQLIQKLQGEQTMPTHQDAGLREKLAQYMHMANQVAYQAEPPEDNMLMTMAKVGVKVNFAEALRDFRSKDPASQFRAAQYFLQNLLKTHLEGFYPEFYQDQARKNASTRPMGNFQVFQDKQEFYEVTDYKGTWVLHPDHYLDKLVDVAKQQPAALKKLLLPLKDHQAIKLVAATASYNQVRLAIDALRQRFTGPAQPKVAAEDKPVAEALAQYNAPTVAERLKGIRFFAQMLAKQPALKDDMKRDILTQPLFTIAESPELSKISEELVQPAQAEKSAKRPGRAKKRTSKAKAS